VRRLFCNRTIHTLDGFETVDEPGEVQKVGKVWVVYLKRWWMDGKCRLMELRRCPNNAVRVSMITRIEENICVATYK
jgi:hypothetical protein